MNLKLGIFRLDHNLTLDLYKIFSISAYFNRTHIHSYNKDNSQSNKKRRNHRLCEQTILSFSGITENSAWAKCQLLAEKHTSFSPESTQELTWRIFLSIIPFCVPSAFGIQREMDGYIEIEIE